LKDAHGRLGPKAGVELDDDRACAMIRSDFGYQLTSKCCESGRASPFLFGASVVMTIAAVAFGVFPL
jgi:hypothetical protein